MSEQVGFGDAVSYAFDGYAGLGVIIGRHARWPEIVCAANEKFIGMTLNAGHCQKTGDAHEEATRLRARYEASYPGFLAAEKMP